jgi:hypothetical protein
MAARASIRWIRAVHYDRWREDFDLVQDLGIHYLRYGPPIYRTFLGPGKYDWEFSDLTFAELKRRDITPIVDLCHFGVPDWLGNFQNPDFADPVRQLCRSLRDRYPWIQVYTPVNEMFICAIFSAKYGWWNEQMKTDRAFVTALKNIVKGNVPGDDGDIEAPAGRDLSSSPNPRNISTPTARPAIGPGGEYELAPFLSLDLNYGRRVDSEMYEYLMDNGMTRDGISLLPASSAETALLSSGNDYYMTNEHRVFADGHTTSSGEVFGYTEITRQYYNRYRLPVMHTETNLREGPKGDEAVQWLWKEWAKRASGCATSGSRPSALHGIRLPIRSIGIPRFASRTATSIRSASTTSIATFVQWARRTRS